MGVVTIWNADIDTEQNIEGVLWVGLGQCVELLKAQSQYIDRVGRMNIYTNIHMNILINIHTDIYINIHMIIWILFKYE